MSVSKFAGGLKAASQSAGGFPLSRRVCMFLHSVFLSFLKVDTVMASGILFFFFSLAMHRCNLFARFPVTGEVPFNLQDSFEFHVP